MDQKEVSGEVKKVDASGNSLTLSASSGSDQSLQVAPGASIIRDGASSSLDQLKEGDSVRASFDPSTKQAIRLEAKSKSGAQPSAAPAPGKQ
jgi:Cu/Ag efflux protein CusF